MLLFWTMERSLSSCRRPSSAARPPRTGEAVGAERSAASARSRRPPGPAALPLAAAAAASAPEAQHPPAPRSHRPSLAPPSLLARPRPSQPLRPRGADHGGAADGARPRDPSGGRSPARGRGVGRGRLPVPAGRYSARRALARLAPPPFLSRTTLLRVSPSLSCLGHRNFSVTQGLGFNSFLPGAGPGQPGTEQRGPSLSNLRRGCSWETGARVG